MSEFFYFALAGTISGMAASMGLGGGTVLLIYLTAIVSVEQLTAQGINLVFFLPIAILSMILHSKKHLIAWKIAIPMALFGLGGSFLGWYLSTVMDSIWIKRGFAAIVLIIGIRQLLFPKKNEDAEKD